MHRSVIKWRSKGGEGLKKITTVTMSIQCKGIREQFLFLRGGHRYTIKLILHSSRSFLSPCLETVWQLSSRSFCNNKATDKSLEDILTESKENRMKDHYPVLGSGKPVQKSPLSELIRELKGDAIEHTITTTANRDKKSKDNSSTRYAVKYNPAGRVSALNKHFDLIYLQQKKDNLSTRKQKMSNFVPDDTEIGELLKSLICKEKFTDFEVKDIMSNIKPKQGGDTEIKEKPVKSTFFSPQRAGSFAHRSLFDGPHSHYFDKGSYWLDSGADSKFVSIHEMKLKQIIKSTVPKLGPTNAFEMMMLEVDKSWKFPIDNEIGLDDEDQSTFEDHVFLNEYLELFPMKGQIRRFMELVITGLQQNPYCSVSEKIDKIYWFKDYFDKFNDEDLDF